MPAGGLKVGEIARQTGLSVRTLHYYDEIGLLAPAQHTDGGHRLYSVGDVARLQQIVSLRQLGLSLDEIRACLDRADCAPLDIVEMHLTRIDAQVESLRNLQGRLRYLASCLRSANAASVETFLEVIERMTMTENEILKHYTPEQLEWLKRRREVVGEERIRQVEAEWPVLIARVQEVMDRGVDPASPEVQAMVRQWQRLVSEFTGGDPGIEQSVRRLHEERTDQAEQFGGPGRAMMEYVNRAIKAGQAGA